MRLKRLPPWILVLLIGALLRALFLVQVWDDPIFFQPVLEDHQHLDQARDVMEGRFPQPELTGGSFLYPYAAAAVMNLFGGQPAAVFVVQILLDLLNIALLYSLCRRWAGSAAAAAGALLYALNPLPAAYAIRMAPVIPAVTVMLFAAGRILPGTLDETRRRADDLAGGILLGLGTLLIPLPFIALGLSALLLRWRRQPVRRRASMTAFMAAGWLILALPALLFNASRPGGAFTFGWTDGYGYFQAFDPETLGSPWKTSPPAWREPGDIRLHVSEDLQDTAVAWGDVERWYATRGTQRILESPFSSLVLLVRKTLLMLARPWIPDPAPLSFALENWAAPFAWGLWLWPLLLALATFEFAGGRRWRTAPMVAAVLLALAVDHLLGPVAGSTRLLALPWISVLAGAGLVRLSTGLRGAGRRALAVPALAAVAVGALSWIDPGGAGTLQQEGEAMRLHARIEERRDGRPEAIRILRRALRRDPGNGRLHTDLGTYLARESFLEQAVESFERALAIDSTSAPALMGIASVMRSSGRSAEAIEYLQRLVENHPQVPVYQNELGTLYLTLGRYLEARRHLEAAVRLNPQYDVALQNLRVLSQMERQVEELVVPSEMRISPGDTLHALSEKMTRSLMRGNEETLDSLAAIARRIRPGHILPDLLQGMYHLQRGDFAAALPYLERANRRAPGRAQIVRHLVGAYLQLGRKEAAVRALEEAAEKAEDETNRELINSLRSGVHNWQPPPER
ncbi:MAG: tetratricopeptide repeat protein [Candidatus Eisenbacteria bacterium]|nr:tetratricopeptide repeat protein [Candidatus Eisenbacteria bacterium]